MIPFSILDLSPIAEGSTPSASLRNTLDLARHATIERRFLLPPADGVTAYRYVIDIAASDAKPHPAAIQLSQSLAPDTSSPLTHSRSWPLMQRI